MTFKQTEMEKTLSVSEMEPLNHKCLDFLIQQQLAFIAQFQKKPAVKCKNKHVKEYEIEIHLNSQVLQEAKLVRYAKCDKPL